MAEKFHLSLSLFSPTNQIIYSCASRLYREFDSIVNYRFYYMDGRKVFNHFLLVKFLISHCFPNMEMDWIGYDELERLKFSATIFHSRIILRRCNNTKVVIIPLFFNREDIS